MIRWPHLPKHPFARLVLVAVSAGFIPLWLNPLMWIPVAEIRVGLAISIVIAHVGIAGWIIGQWASADINENEYREVIRNLYKLLPYSKRTVRGTIYYKHDWEAVERELTDLIKKGLQHDS